MRIVMGKKKLRKGKRTCMRAVGGREGGREGDSENYSCYKKKKEL